MRFEKIIYIKWVAPVFFFNLLIVGLILLLINCLPPEVPLFYGKPVGEEQLTKAIFLIIPPIVAIIFTVVNTIIINLIKDDFIQKTLLAITFFVSVLSTITVLKIILLINSC